MRDAVLLVLADEVLKAFPDGQVTVALRLPIIVEFIARQDAHLAGSALDDPGMLNALDRNTSSPSKAIGQAVISFRHAMLLEPGDRKARVSVELALDAAEILVQLCIDQL